MAPELIHRTREVLPNLKLIQGYGLSETGFLTGLKDHEHTGTGFCHVAELVLGSTSGSSTSQERNWKPGAMVNW